MTESSKEVPGRRPVLELDALAPEREIVHIKYLPPDADEDAKPEIVATELATPDDLSVEDQQWLYSHATKLQQLMEGADDGTLPDGSLAELEMLIDKALEMVLPWCRVEVRSALRRTEKQQVVLVFTLIYTEQLERSVNESLEVAKKKAAEISEKQSLT